MGEIQQKSEFFHPLLRGYCQGLNVLVVVLIQDPQFNGPEVVRSKTLRRHPKDFFEFPAKVGLAGEFQFGGNDLVRVTLENELFGKVALKVSEPTARGAVEVFLKKTLQLALRNGAERGHFDGIKIRLTGDLLPFLHGHQVPIHIAPHG